MFRHYRVCAIGTQNNSCFKNAQIGRYGCNIFIYLYISNCAVFKNRYIARLFCMGKQQVVKAEAGADIAVAFFAFVNEWYINMVVVGRKYFNPVRGYFVLHIMEVGSQAWRQHFQLINDIYTQCIATGFVAGKGCLVQQSYL